MESPSSWPSLEPRGKTMVGLLVDIVLIVDVDVDERVMENLSSWPSLEPRGKEKLGLLVDILSTLMLMLMLNKK